MSQHKDVKKLLESLSPDQQAVAKTIAILKLENKELARQVEALKKDHQDLYKVMLVVLDACEDRELRIHETQFLRFREEYRIEREFDKGTKEVVLKLLTLKD